MPDYRLTFKLVAYEMAYLLQNRLGVQHWPMVKLAPDPFAAQSMTLDSLSDAAFHIRVDRTGSTYSVHAIYIGAKGDQCEAGVGLYIYPEDLRLTIKAFSQQLALPAMAVMANVLRRPEAAEWCLG